jgi:hypothetical protein
LLAPLKARDDGKVLLLVIHPLAGYYISGIYNEVVDMLCKYALFTASKTCELR